MASQIVLARIKCVCGYVSVYKPGSTTVASGTTPLNDVQPICPIFVRALPAFQHVHIKVSRWSPPAIATDARIGAKRDWVRCRLVGV